MELTELKHRIMQSFSGSKKDLFEIISLMEKDESVFPFNEYEHLICTLIDKGDFTFEQYLEIRTEYINANPNLWIFEISAPRTFGEKFAQTYVHGKCTKLQKPSKKLDPTYSGQYDFWLDEIMIEVKASRAVDSDSSEPLYVKALSRKTKRNFLMNFQQLKPQCCDVFIWVAVFRNEIVLWVMSSQEVLENPIYSKGQHRGNKGNEGQLHINQGNVCILTPYELKDADLETAIREAYLRGLASKTEE